MRVLAGMVTWVPNCRDKGPKKHGWAKAIGAYAMPMRSLRNEQGTNIDVQLPCLFVCLSVYLFLRLFVCLFVCSFVLFACLFAFLPFLPFPTSNTAYAAKISTNVLEMPTQPCAHHLNAYATTWQDYSLYKPKLPIKNVAQSRFWHFWSAKCTWPCFNTSAATAFLGCKVSWGLRCSNHFQGIHRCLFLHSIHVSCTLYNQQST